MYTLHFGSNGIIENWIISVTFRHTYIAKNISVQGHNCISFTNGANIQLLYNHWCLVLTNCLDIYLPYMADI